MADESMAGIGKAQRRLEKRRERERARYRKLKEQRIAAGLCVSCGLRPPKLTSQICPPCQDAKNARRRVGREREQEFASLTADMPDWKRRWAVTHRILTDLGKVYRPNPEVLHPPGASGSRTAARHAKEKDRPLLGGMVKRARAILAREAA